MSLHDRRARVLAGEVMEEESDDFDRDMLFNRVRVCLLQGQANKNTKPKQNKNN
jgi:hypothetical protein